MDRKRESEELGSNSKRIKPLDILSEDGPLTQSDVVYFKKEAIWRQMKFYKDKFNVISNEYKKLQSSYEGIHKAINVLDAWYGELVNIFSKRSDSTIMDENILLPVDLQLNNEFESALKIRREQLLKVLSPLMDKEHMDPEKSELMTKIEYLSSELAKNESKNKFTLKLSSDLKEEVSRLREQVDKNLVEKNRSESKTLKRIDENSSNVTDEEKNGQSRSPENGEGGEFASDKVEKAAFEQLNQELEILKSSEKLFEQKVKHLTLENEQMKKESDSLRLRFSNLNEKDLQRSPIYQELLTHNRELQQNLTDIQAANSAAVSQVNELQSKIANISDSISKELIEENESLKGVISKLESDLVRIRTARDDLLSRQTILKAQLDEHQGSPELLKMNDILSKRLQEKEKSNDVTNDDSKFSSLSKEDLIQQICMLTSEIKEIESAFQETRNITVTKLASQIEQQNIVKKLTLEKTKADQKYFAAMRAKDSITAENKVLKAQVSKSQELINKLHEMEKMYLDKIEILSSSANDFRIIKESSIHENNKLQTSLQSLIAKVSALEKENDSVKSDAHNSSKDLSELSKLHSDLKFEYSKLESKFKSVDSMLKKYKSNNKSAILQEDEKQLQALRSIAKCSVCSKNWKDTAIIGCGHVFCSHCAQERLAARLRRCPTCNKGFSANDLLTIHL